MISNKCLAQRAFVSCRWNLHNYQWRMPLLQQQQQSWNSSSISVRNSSTSSPAAAAAADKEYQDLSLVWASTHREEAQACLNRPTTDHLSVSNAVTPEAAAAPSRIISTFEEYWAWRGWNFPVKNPEHEKHAHNLVTHVLSEPMSVGMLLLPQIAMANSIKTKSSIRLCCIGARAEAMLPVEYWMEIILLAKYYYGGIQPDCSWKKKGLHLTVDFIGPEVLRRPPIRQICRGGGSLTLQWLYNGKFHEYMDHSKKGYVSDGVAVPSAPSPEQNASWDAMILCNPGIGHSYLKHEWKPTLDLLLSNDHQHRTPLLLTAHSWLDAQRDGLVLTDYLLEQAPLYRENPWASRITYQDPLSQSKHMVQPNHFYHIIS